MWIIKGLLIMIVFKPNKAIAVPQNISFTGSGITADYSSTGPSQISSNKMSVLGTANNTVSGSETYDKEIRVYTAKNNLTPNNPYAALGVPGGTVALWRTIPSGKAVSGLQSRFSGSSSQPIPDGSLIYLYGKRRGATLNEYLGLFNPRTGAGHSHCIVLTLEQQKIDWEQMSIRVMSLDSGITIPFGVPFRYAFKTLTLSLSYSSVLGQPVVFLPNAAGSALVDISQYYYINSLSLNSISVPANTVLKMALVLDNNYFILDTNNTLVPILSSEIGTLGLTYAQLQTRIQNLNVIAYSSLALAFYMLTNSSTATPYVTLSVNNINISAIKYDP